MKGIAITKHFRTPVVSVVAVFAACLVVLLLGVRVTDAQTSSPAYTVTDLGTLGGNYSLAYDINNNGEIVGTSGTSENAVRYKNGQWQYLNNLIPADSGWNLQRAEAINDEGQIVGWGSMNGETHAFLLTPGSSTPSDTTKPTITVNSPIEGATYKLGESVAADYSCSDDTSSGSDLSCTGSVPNGSALDTSSVGPKTFTVTSTDKAGNTETKTVNYSVIYNFCGFFQPVDNLPTFNKTKAGKTIPVRFSLGGNQGTDIFADGFPKSAPVACNSTAPVDGIEETVLGKQGLTYDPVSNRYTYDWATSSGWSGCRQLVVKFKDDTVQRANFTFR